MTCGTTTVVLNKLDKINEGQTQLNNKDHYRERAQPMVIKTDCKVRQLVNELYRKNHIDDTTRKWLVIHQARLVSQYSTLLQRFRNQVQLVAR